MKIEEFVDTSVFPWWIPVGIVLGTIILTLVFSKFVPEQHKSDYFSLLMLVLFLTTIFSFLLTTIRYDYDVSQAETDHYSAQAEAVNQRYGLEAQERLYYSGQNGGSLAGAIAKPGNCVDAGISYEETDGVLQRIPLVIKLDEDWNLTVYKSLEGDKLEELKPASN